MGSDYEESDDEELHKALGMTKEAVESLVRRRIAKHKNRILDDDSDAEIDQNVFNPIDFIVKELKAYQSQKGKKWYPKTNDYYLFNNVFHMLLEKNINKAFARL